MTIYTTCLKKVPTFTLSVTLSKLSKFLHCWKAYKICYKTLRHYLSHLTHVATLPWEIKNSNFLQVFRYERKCNQIAFLSPLTFLFIHTLDIFVVENSEFFTILVANKIFHVTVLLSLVVYF